MATLNLGRIKPVFRGAYAGGTAYVVDDIVTSGNETFICIQASTGNATSNASYWTKLAAKGTDGTDVGTTITTQGDLLYRDGSGLQRLAKGTASQQLAMNSGATAPEWITASSGGILQVKQTTKTDTTSTSSQTWSDIAGMTVDITPSSASNKILIMTDTNHSGTNSYGQGIRLMRGSTAIYHTTDPNTSQQSGTWGTIADPSGASFLIPVSKIFLDAPNTTSATTYKLQWFQETGSTGYLNRRHGDGTNAYSTRGASSITVMEIASGAL